ncbi:MAG: alanine--tRNA ligase [Alphaproteobacteria bacterium CG_4_10_14_0_2_um_filter_63_37]|nr:MAG: alanine--tRNA ligase [Proteobacteria bacterium CG1_02_64_396]PJA25317.1 MAG: alanine--tRNA ligase [Alphaproteobacteria bacterium CG_4_10_14_0_2_um_filter_63_37]
MLNADEIRRRFLDYFARQGHEPVASAPLIPMGDPTLLFTNAGMVPFKDVFTGRERRPYTRATSSQKCVRAGGKHNDLENVGRTARHHTFFEMLGNFSFGDYFKDEAIALAWGFLTQDLKLPVNKLWITVFEGDETTPADTEAEQLWLKAGVPANRIVRCGAADNFWSIGDTGPCGPCSEIHFDQGPRVPGDDTPNGEGDRVIEIWNLVFMQYDRSADGTLTPLPKPSIDTGMGLERLTAVVQGQTSNYHTDLFMPLIDAAAALAGIEYGQDGEKDVSLRVIADHLRAATFLIGDGVLPSNEGRGYVLRRIMRRAIRHGKLLGLGAPFMHQLVSQVVDVMGGAYPALHEQKSATSWIVKTEEERFFATLERGWALLDQAIAKLDGGKVLPGEVVFQLYDTYGFPVDLTADMVEGEGISLDMAGFEAAMAEQRARSRAHWAGSGQTATAAVWHDLHDSVGATEFVGYTGLQAVGTIRALLVEGEQTELLTEGQSGTVLLDQTPFYGESGGQSGDSGTLNADGAVVAVENATKPIAELIAHKVTVQSGAIKVGQQVLAQVDVTQRRMTAVHHSATHLLHAALRKVLGDHVKQAGSLVEAGRLRFDFNHPAAVTREQLVEIEDIVNRSIWSNVPVSTTVMTPDEAVAAGAMALFGEKYGEQVRVVSMGDHSMELCGGTHVIRTGDIGVLHIRSEAGIASGVRRIEAVAGALALSDWRKREDQVAAMAQSLKGGVDQVEERLEQLQARLKESEAQLKVLQKAQAAAQASELLGQTREIGGVKVLAAQIGGLDPKGLKEFAEDLRNRLGPNAAVLMALPLEDKVQLLATVGKEASGKIGAGDWIKTVAAEVGGRGGGKPDLAQAGGPDVAALPKALEVARSWAAEKLGG